MANYFDSGANPFSDNGGVEKTYTVGDTLSWQKGRHSLKFGVEYKHHGLNEISTSTRAARFSFSDSLPRRRSPEMASTIFSEALRFCRAHHHGSGVNNRDLQAHDWNGFANDDWRVDGSLYAYFGRPLRFLRSVHRSPGTLGRI